MPTDVADNTDTSERSRRISRGWRRSGPTFRTPGTSRRERWVISSCRTWWTGKIKETGSRHRTRSQATLEIYSNVRKRFIIGAPGGEEGGLWAVYDPFIQSQRNLSLTPNPNRTLVTVTSNFRLTTNLTTLWNESNFGTAAVGTRTCQERVQDEGTHVLRLYPID